jgi:hypothetical protein
MRPVWQPPLGDPAIGSRLFVLRKTHDALPR